MIRDDQNDVWKQHFPTYHFSERDIALEEYQVAAKALESEERVFLNASNITLVASATLGSLAVSSTEKLSTKLAPVLPNYATPIVLLLVVTMFALISVKYFADRQRAITFASRKIVILRRMLGLSYGRVQLVLPNWRVEGADQPLSIKLFPGWFTYAAYPFWILLIISSCISFLLLAMLIKSVPLDLISVEPLTLVAMLTALWILIFTLIFRTSLLDTHENLRLLITQRASKLISLPVAPNIEYLIYRANLATYETDRHKVSLKNLMQLLVFIEDRDFYKHSGISYKAIGRGILSLFKLKRRSGGSTIHQQLVRTLFILDLSKTKRRKFVEILLAPWLDKALEKRRILEVYICSVRYENRCFGVVPAMQHFFGEIIQNPSKAQAFFLVERVSNIRKSLLANKIVATAKTAKEKGILSDSDLKELSSIYKRVVSDGKVIDHNNSLERLVEQLNA
ncbi:TPA: biosynthetic peptidoglycan transglycosylase [Vibrio diabolicus]